MEVLEKVLFTLIFTILWMGSATIAILEWFSIITTHRIVVGFLWIFIALIMAIMSNSLIIIEDEEEDE